MNDFDDIYRLYAKDVYRFLLKLSANPDVAEELTSETFYRAIKNISSYKGGCKISVWLMAIGKNLYFDYLKKHERKNVPLENDEFACDNDIIISFENNEQAMKVHKILHGLEEPYKEVFTLRVFSELSFKEIGSLFGKSDGWARIIFFRAKEKIIRIMNSDDREDE